MQSENADQKETQVPGHGQDAAPGRGCEGTGGGPGQAPEPYADGIPVPGLRVVASDQPLVRETAGALPSECRAVRHEIYAWLAKEGLRGMGEHEGNRGRVCGLLERYAKAKNETLLRELKMAQRTEAERKAAWRAKHERAWARKKAKKQL